MRGTWIKRALLAVALLLVAAGFVYALLPEPVPVDRLAITRGPLEVTVDEEGESRIREVYTVSAPISGTLLRSPREVGDEVVAGDTVVAVIEPTAPSFLDIRTRRELKAAVAAAEAAVARSRTEIVRAQSELKFAESDLNRTQSLAERGTVSQRTLEEASLKVEVSRAALDQAKANLELRKRELESTRARLIGPDRLDIEPGEEACCIKVRAPVNGQVLNITRESEKVVQAGEPLLEIGDPQDLEIIVDLLSTDAVKVSAGDAARIEGWGGEGALEAKVRRVDPSGFTKVSALGIEEQRVNTILDFTGPKEKWQNLGHDFRVFVRITVWKSDDALRVPLSALFRHGQDWAVFKAVDGRAKLTRVTIGHRNTQMAEVLEGLTGGDEVVLHPSDRVADGVRIERRNSDGQAVSE